MKVTASEKSVPAAASKIAIVSGNNQSANPNTLLPTMLIVSVTDTYGNAISGYTVDFSDNGAWRYVLHHHAGYQYLRPGRHQLHHWIEGGNGDDHSGYHRDWQRQLHETVN